jgi:hypothetical protein
MNPWHIQITNLASMRRLIIKELCYRGKVKYVARQLFDKVEEI